MRVQTKTSGLQLEHSEHIAVWHVVFQRVTRNCRLERGGMRSVFWLVSYRVETTMYVAIGGVVQSLMEPRDVTWAGRISVTVLISARACNPDTFERDRGGKPFAFGFCVDTRRQQSFGMTGLFSAWRLTY